jgi:hypothetical protein
MPTGTRSKGTGVRTRKTAAKVRAKRGSGRRSPTKLTTKMALEFLEKMKANWAALGGEVQAVETLIQKLPADALVTGAVRKEFEKLVKHVGHELRCPYPYHVQNICV